MIFQWYLFAILFGVYLFSYMSSQIYEIDILGQKEKRVKWFPVLVMVAVLSYVAATRDPYIGDTYAYRRGFMQTSDRLADIPAAFFAEGKDRGFTVLSIFIKHFIGDRVELYFGIIAGFCLFCVLGVYRKYSCSFFMSVFLFLASGEYVQWTHNGMRQFMAVSMIFSATGLLLQKRYGPYFAVVLLASSIHASALIMIPMSIVVQGKPWNNKTVLFMLAVLISVTSVDTLTGAITNLMENTQYASEVDQFLDTSGTNSLRVLVFCIPPVLSLAFRRWCPEGDPLYDLSVNMSVASMGTYIVSMFTSGIFIGRMPVYFSLYNYMLLPSIIQRSFEKRSASLILLMVMGCYMFFYYYQMHVTWGLG